MIGWGEIFQIAKPAFTKFGLIYFLWIFVCHQIIVFWFIAIESRMRFSFKCKEADDFRTNGCLSSYKSSSVLQNPFFLYIIHVFPVVFCFLFAIIMNYYVASFKKRKSFNHGKFVRLHKDQLYGLQLALFILHYLCFIIVYISLQNEIKIKDEFKCTLSRNITTTCTDSDSGRRTGINCLSIAIFVFNLILTIGHSLWLCRAELPDKSLENCLRCKTFIGKFFQNSQETDEEVCLNAIRRESNTADGANHLNTEANNESYRIDESNASDVPRPITTSSHTDTELNQSIGDLNQNAFTWLAARLDPDHPNGNWEQLARLFELKRKDILLIRDGGRAHRHFFDTLLAEKPNLTLSNIRDKLENHNSKPRRDIFSKMQKNNKMPANMDKAIDEFSDDDWDFVLINIADELVERNGIGDWRDLAGSLDFSRKVIESIQHNGASKNYSQTRLLLDKLGSKGRVVSDLVAYLRKMERNDVANELERMVNSGEYLERK